MKNAKQEKQERRKMELGIFEPFVTPPFSPVRHAKRLMRELLLMEYQTLVFLDRHGNSLGSIVHEIYRVVPEELMSKMEELSNRQLCYIWDLILLVHVYRQQHPTDRDQRPETIVFYLQMYHLGDNLRRIHQSYLELTPSQLISLRYLPLQGISWLQKIDHGFDFFPQEPDVATIEIAPLSLSRQTETSITSQDKSSSRSSRSSRSSPRGRHSTRSSEHHSYCSTARQGRQSKRRGSAILHCLKCL